MGQALPPANSPQIEFTFDTAVTPSRSFPGTLPIRMDKSFPMQPEPDTRSRATAAYTAPFLVFVALVALERALGLNPSWAYPLRMAAVLATLAAFSRPLLQFRFTLPAASIGVGVLVFAVWVVPDTLFHYRHHWLLENSLTHVAAGSLPDRAAAQPWVSGGADRRLRAGGSGDRGAVLARLVDALANGSRLAESTAGNVPGRHILAGGC